MNMPLPSSLSVMDEAMKQRLPPSPQSRAFARIGLARQFQLGSLAVLLVGMIGIGLWLSHQIEQSVVNRAASISAAYVESILADHLGNWRHPGALPPPTLAALDHIFIGGPLQRKVVRFKLWDRDSIIRYSSDHRQLGESFPDHPPLRTALSGQMQVHYSALDGEDNAAERDQWHHLLEIYVPIRRADNRAEVIAVAEFYHSTENLEREIAAAQQNAWGSLGVATAVIYLLLLSLIRRADKTIESQRADLQKQLTELQAALADNRRMQSHLSEAGARTTALNEKLLHRITADLHDGPAQHIAFSLLRFDEVAGNCSDFARCEVSKMHAAMREALDELRAIAAGLPLPGLEELTLAATAERAVQDCQRLWGKAVRTEIDPALARPVPLAVKITLYRVIQESLTNSWRHAPDGQPQLRVRLENECVEMQLEDSGAGFDIETAEASGRLGLPFMRERVRMLGGEFSVTSAPGHGTQIRAVMPLCETGAVHA